MTARIEKRASKAAPMLGALLLLWCVCGSAQAMSLRELATIHMRNTMGPALAEFYVIGVAEGLIEANEAGKRTGQAPLFCLAQDRWTPKQANTLFNAEASRNADVYEADMPVGLVMQQALINTYPCEP
jgi:hypothetical protein